MAYRASAVEPKTTWARHLDAVMRKHDWSRVRLFEEVGAEMGYRVKSRSAFLRFLNDTEPNEDQAAVLRKHFGNPPEAELAPATPVQDPLLTVLGRIATALEKMAGIDPEGFGLSPGDSTVLRAVAAQVGQVPTTPSEHRQEEASA